MNSKIIYKTVLFTILLQIFGVSTSAQAENSDLLDTSRTQYLIFPMVSLKAKFCFYSINSSKNSPIGKIEVDLMEDQIFFKDNDHNNVGVLKNNKEDKTEILFGEEEEIKGKIINKLKTQNSLKIFNENDEFIIEIERTKSSRTGRSYRILEIFNSEGRKIGYLNKIIPFGRQLFQSKFTLVLSKNPEELDRRLLLGSIARYLISYNNN